MNRYGNCEYERVSKRTARRLFNEGTKIYALPCKMRLIDSSYGIYVETYFLRLQRLFILIS